MENKNLAQPGELKPCPMCGNPEPVLYDFDGEDWGIECGVCVVQTIMVDRREQAVADWNRRAPTAEDGAAELSRLRGALQRIADMHTGNVVVNGIAYQALRGYAPPPKATDAENR